MSKIERILGLDISTKTGFSVIVSGEKDFTLEAYGKIDKTSEPKEAYPGSYVTWAYQCFGKIIELIELHKPDVLVIEETAGGSKSAYSQKILEFIHFLMARYIKESGIKSVYYQTETWRRIVGCIMTKEEKENNKKIKGLRKKNPDIKVIKNEKGKRIGKIGRKHVNVRRANELFGKFLKEPLILADEDQADGLLLAMAHILSKKNG